MIFNLHNVGIYSVKDFYLYFRKKKYKDFNYFGITMFVGMFGKGKTLSMVRKARQIYAQYGDSVGFISNIELKGIPYEPLISFEQICNLGEQENNRKGTIVLIDEVSSVLSHRNYAKFPIEMLNVLTQQRKKRVYIMCTAQRFFMVDKLFRAITTYVVDCDKYWRFQRNKYFDAWELENATNSALLRHKGIAWFFVKDKDFNSYETLQLITRNASEDFISNDESIRRKGLEAGLVFNEVGINRPSSRFKKMRRNKKK